MDETVINRKWTRSGSKSDEDGGIQAKKTKSVQFKVSHHNLCILLLDIFYVK